MAIFNSDRGAAWVALLTAAVLFGCGGSSTVDSSGDGREPASGLQDDFYSGGDSATESVLIDVPDVAGLDGDEAVSSLESEGFLVDFTEDSGRDAASCEVLNQDLSGQAEEGAEIVLELDCRQVDWENQEGEDWELFDASYLEAWATGCADVFATESPDGALYTDDGDEVTDLDCPSPPYDASDADISIDVPDAPDVEGETLGLADGCEALFDGVAYSGSLHTSEDQEIYSYVCP